VRNCDRVVIAWWRLARARSRSAELTASCSVARGPTVQAVEPWCFSKGRSCSAPEGVLGLDRAGRKEQGYQALEC